MNFKNWLSKNYPFVFIFLFFTYINFLSPPVGDDWEISRWLSVNSSGDIIMSLKGVYWNWKYFNGRRLSNFLMSFFCYHKFIWNFASAGIITYIIFAFSKLFNFKKNVNALLLLILLLLSVSDGIRVEVYSQICSNIAYMIPIVSILYFLLKFKKVFNQREQVYSKTTLITTIIICIFISTLMENVSAGFTATLAIFNLYFFIKNKKINKLLFISLLSSLVGSIFMFTSPGIRLSRELYNHSLGIVSTFKNSLFSNISLIIFQNKFIFLIITLITIVAINTNSINIKHKLIKYLYLSFVFLILFILSVSVVNNYIFIPQKIMSLTYYFFSRRFLVSFFWLTFLLSFIIPVLYIIRNKKIFLFLLSVAIFSLIPASLITQTGARIIAIIVFIMIGISSGFYSKIESNKLTFWLICFGIIVQSNKLLTIYHDIYKTQKIRQNVIDNTIILQHQQKWDYDQPLILPAFKTNHLLYNANPPPLNTSGHYLNFIRFYNLNPKTKVIFDDGFAYLNLNFKLNKNNESIIEIKPLENKYKYLFYIYKDGIEYFKSNYSNQTFIKINLNDPGKYTARCDMNLDGKVKTAYTDDYIIIN